MERKVGDYYLEKHIGSGTFGKVYLATHSTTQEKVAIKIIKKSEHKINLAREYDLMMKIHHPFIVSLYQVIEDEESLYIVMEYVEGPTLLEYIKEQAKLPDWKIKHFFCEILSALIYLHDSLNIVHRDLKLENIIIDKRMNVRLLDFGLSNQQKDDASMFFTTCGSPSYSAPEMLLSKPYTYKVDMWGLGIILYALSFNSLPFGDVNIHSLTEKVIKKDPFYPVVGNNQIIFVIKTLLNKNPDMRPSSIQTAQIPWVNSYNNNFILKENFNSSEKWEPLNNDVKSKIMRRKQINDEFSELYKTTGEINSFKGGFMKQNKGRNHLLGGIKLPQHGSTFQHGAKRLIINSSPKQTVRYD